MKLRELCSWMHEHSDIRIYGHSDIRTYENIGLKPYAVTGRGFTPFAPMRGLLGVRGMLPVNFFEYPYHLPGDSTWSLYQRIPWSLYQWLNLRPLSAHPLNSRAGFSPRLQRPSNFFWPPGPGCRDHRISSGLQAPVAEAFEFLLASRPPMCLFAIISVFLVTNQLETIFRSGWILYKTKFS